MSFKQWLMEQLLEDGVIDESWDEDEVTRENLVMQTELEEDDIENYCTQFEEHCAGRSEEPCWDLED